MESKDRETLITPKPFEAEAARRAAEDKLRNALAELSEKRGEIKDLERQLNEARNANVDLENTIESLRQVIQLSQEKQSRFEAPERPENDYEELQQMIMARDRKISKLKEKMGELEEEKRDFERNLQSIRRQLNGSVGNNRVEHQTKFKNGCENSNLMRLKIIRLQGEVAQKDLKIESLNQKISYLKQKDQAARRVRENLNEFHRDLFGSFDMSKRR